MMRRSFCILGTAIMVTGSYSQVLTYDLTYGPAGLETSTLVGQMTIDTSDPGASSELGFAALPSWVQTLDFTYTAGGTPTTYTRSDFDQIAWDPDGAVDWNSDLVPQFSDINFFGTDLAGFEIFTIEHFDSGDLFVLQSATPVPEPATYAGIFALGLAAFAMYRARTRGLSEDPTR
jgi:hypothetical protein